MEKKIQKTYVDNGLGFPVVLHNVPMIKVRGEWTTDIKYNAYMKAVLELLCDKESALTGDEVRFIRTYFEMTLEQFASRFNVSHAGVIKWEKSGDNATKMNWSTEKDLRLYIFKKIFSDVSTKKTAPLMVELYERLEAPVAEGNAQLEIDVKKLAA